MTGLQSPIKNKVFTVPLPKLIWKILPSLLISNKPLQCETKGARQANNLMLSCSAKNYTSCYDRRLISWQEVSQRAAQLSKLSNGKLSPLLKVYLLLQITQGKPTTLWSWKRFFFWRSHPQEKAMFILPIWFPTGRLAGKHVTRFCVYVGGREKLFPNKDIWGSCAIDCPQVSKMWFWTENIWDISQSRKSLEILEQFFR